MVAKGTIIKLAVSIELPSGLTMDDIDFECKFSVTLNSQTIKKSEMVRNDENSYTCFLDTNIIGRGEIWIETTAYLPDTDYEGGIRPEVDKSDAVNSLTLDGKQIWLDKDTRVGLVNSINIEKEAGRVYTTLWYNAEKYVIPVNDALNTLDQLELYALDCYNTTQAHIAAVKNLFSKEEVNSYNYKTGYPEKLNFVL